MMCGVNKVLCLTLAFAGMATFADDLADCFRTPSPSSRPQVWWHWMNGNVTKEGITADLEAMKAIGIGGAHIFDVNCGIPKGPVGFNTPAWHDHVRWAAHEAKRLGIELGLSNWVPLRTRMGGSCASLDCWLSSNNTVKHV